MYYVDFGTGAGNFEANTLEDAMIQADDNAAYTQRDISIYHNGVCVAKRRWRVGQGNLSNDIISYNIFGYFDSWQDMDGYYI